MSSKYTVGRLVALGLVVAACFVAPAAAITDPPASTGAASSYYTPEALKAQALRWTAMAQLYSHSSRPDDRGGTRTSAPSTPAQVLVTKSSFDWNDAGIGAATGFVLAVCMAAGVMFTRREKLAV
jgi:hypothetical protein